MTSNNNLYITILLGLLVILVIGAVLNREALFQQQQKKFLIVGPPFGGKTTLFHLLTTSQLPKYPTVLSQVPVEVTDYKLPQGGVRETFTLKVYPGSSKLLNLYLYKDLKDKKFLKSVKGIVFVIDSASIKESESVRILFEILTHTEYLPNGIDILVACNKQDLFQSRPVFKIIELIQAEFNKLKQNQLKNLNRVDANEEEEFNEFFNNSVEKFTFDQLEGNFDFLEGSVAKKEIDKWECWLTERAVN